MTRPSEELDVERTMTRLGAALVVEDPLLDGGWPPALAAMAHRQRCSWRPAPSRFEDGLYVPEVETAGGVERRRCCGLAVAIELLLGVSSNRPEWTTLLEATVRTEPQVAALRAMLDAPLASLIAQLDVDRARLVDMARGAGIAPAVEHLREAVPSPLPRSWLVDALRSLEQSDPSLATAEALRTNVATLRDAVHLVDVARARVCARLRAHHVLSSFYIEEEGPGRPRLLLVRALARLLHETGHPPGQIARLLVTGGELGGASRIRELLKPTRTRRKSG